MINFFFLMAHYEKHVKRYDIVANKKFMYIQQLPAHFPNTVTLLHSFHRRE